MGFVVVLCAALVASCAVYLIPAPKNLRVRQLAAALWGALAVLLVVAVLDRWSGLGLHDAMGVDLLAAHASLGFFIVAAILGAWSVFCLFNGFGRGGDDR